jgi:O-6-methylguanine DNA methyltransferase
MPVAAATTSPRHVVVDSPLGPLTLVRDDGLAHKIGGVSPRDVGRLVGDNPLSILIPCHRVLGSTGKLTGYAGGLSRKRYLLQLEQAVPPSPQGL